MVKEEEKVQIALEELLAFVLYRVGRVDLDDELLQSNVLVGKTIWIDRDEDQAGFYVELRDES